MTTSLEQQREDQALGAAWRRLAELLPRHLTLEWEPNHATVTFEAASYTVGWNGGTPEGALAVVLEMIEKWKAEP